MIPVRRFSTTRTKPSIRSLIAFIVFVWLPAANWAQNLLTNPGFDTDLNGWTRGAFVPDWSPMDADGLSNSGSARYLHTIDAGGAFLMSQCLPVAAAAAYDLRADLRLLPAGNESGVGVFVRSFSGSTCTGAHLDIDRPFRLLGENSDGLWTSLQGTYVAPADATRVQIEVSIGGADGGVEAFVDNVAFCVEDTCDEGGGDLSPCVEGPTTACLLDERFEVTVEWRDFQDGSGLGQVMMFEGVRASSDESVFFWFFSPTNFEMGVKMVDACAPPFDRFWVFVSGLTNVSFQVRVRDTETGAERAYSNPLGTLPQTVGDVEAFTCEG